MAASLRVHARLCLCEAWLLTLWGLAADTAGLGCSDRYGRRTTLLASIGSQVVCTLLFAYTTGVSVKAAAAARLVGAYGACALRFSTHNHRGSVSDSREPVVVVERCGAVRRALAFRHDAACCVLHAAYDPTPAVRTI